MRVYDNQSTQGAFVRSVAALCCPSPQHAATGLYTLLQFCIKFPALARAASCSRCGRHTLKQLCQADVWLLRRASSLERSARSRGERGNTTHAYQRCMRTHLRAHARPAARGGLLAGQAVNAGTRAESWLLQDPETAVDAAKAQMQIALMGMGTVTTLHKLTLHTIVGSHRPRVCLIAAADEVGAACAGRAGVPARQQRTASSSCVLR